MLKTPAPFPNVGSWALLEEGGRTLPVRIVLRDGAEARITIAGEFGASGAKRVPIAALQNADALNQREQAELLELETSMAGKARPKKADVARADELGKRQIRAQQLQDLLARIPARHFPAVVAARAA